MNLKVNSKSQEFDRVQNLEELLYTLLQKSEKYRLSGVDGIAVAVNHSVIPKEKWAETSLQEKDEITILQAVQGG